MDLFSRLSVMQLSKIEKKYVCMFVIMLKDCKLFTSGKKGNFFYMLCVFLTVSTLIQIDMKLRNNICNLHLEIIYFRHSILVPNFEICYSPFNPTIISLCIINYENVYFK